MLKTEREKLLNRRSDYISIGITADGKPKGGISVPWEETGHAFNMKTPSVYISPEDLEDESLMEMLTGLYVNGLYTWIPLRDYGFISRFNNIWDLNIKYGDNITDLDFLKGLNECSMLFLHNAKLKNLDVILDMKKSNKGIFGGFRCLCLCNCRVEDISRFETEKPHFSEFLIWNDKEHDERERWKIVSANTWRYYEIDG